MRGIVLQTASFFLYRGMAFLLLTTLAVSDVLLFLPFNNGFVESAYAATGDFSIYRESAGTQSVTTSALNTTWDTTVVESSNIALQGDSSSIDLADGGKYLVLYNTWAQVGTSTGTDRRSFETYLALNGSELRYGRGGGYIRDASAEDEEAYAAGGAIIQASAGADLGVKIARDDTNSAGSNIRPGTNGVSVLKLNDSFDYLRVYLNTRSSDISGNTSFTDVVFDTSEEVDTGSFGFTASSTSSNITLKGSAGKKFLITYNVRLNQDEGSSNRQNYEGRLTLDGSEVSGTRSTTYIRGNPNTHGTINGTIVYTGIIEKTSSSDQILNVEMRRESVNGASTDVVDGETALSMVALPSNVEYVSLTSASSAQTLAVSRTPFNWNEQVSLSESVFSHSTTTNNSRITIDTAGNYLFFSTAYTERTSSSDRNVPRIEWRLDGSSVLSYGGHGSFNRGVETGGGNTFTSGSSGGLILNGLTSSQYIELLHSDETGDSPNATFEPGQIAIQGISLSSLAQIDTTVSLAQAQNATTSPSVINYETGAAFAVTENTGSRNITNIILNETGTIDAQNDLDNIKLYYDLDTSAPYDCVSESYGGGESQFGATDTDGFTAADGTVSFTGSVSISTTQTFCGYIVLDIGAGAKDGETLNIEISDPNTDVIVTSSGLVGPAVPVGSSDTTTVVDAEITQAYYHWRNDDGSETGATSATGGTENSPALSFSTTTPQRLRMSVYADGTGGETMNLRLEFAEKADTCSAATGWTDIDSASDDWDLFDSTNITNGDDTTDIAVANGGVSNPATTFTTDNNALLDTSSESGALDISYGSNRAVGEFGTVTNTNGATSTVSLTNTYTSPVVVASVRYNRTTEAFRTARITKKTSSSFDILTDDFGGDATGSTVVDYVVMEAGTWEIQDSAGTRQVIATTTESITSVSGGGSYSSAGTAFTWNTAFDAAPAVIATVSTYNSSDWMMAHVSDGASRSNPPDSTDFGVYLGRSHAAVNAYSEDIDVIAFEQGHGTNGGEEYDAVLGPDDVVTNTPATVDFSSSFTSAPAVTLIMQGAEQGGNGATASRHTGTVITTSGVSAAVDEDGDTVTFDRAHTAEPIAVVSFANSSGNLYTNEIVGDNYIELEYALTATATATEGIAYCFRLTDAGTPLRNYDVYPEATLNADVTVSATGTQVTSLQESSSNNHVGGMFVITDNADTRNITDITIAESGTIDAATSIENVELYYELDTTAPYNCAGETYAGTELQFGSTDVDGFSSANGTSSFSGSVAIATTSAMCVYTILDINASSTNGETIDIEIVNPSSDVVASSGSVGPGSTVAIAGSTTVNGKFLTQTGYHFREDNGTEATASSSSGGLENTPIESVQRNTTKRIRLAVSNEGAATSPSTQYRLEYGTKFSSCSLISNWQDVDVGSAITMASTSNLVDGDDTIDIATTTGGVTNPNDTFLTPNGGQKEDDSQTAGVTLTDTEFVELEYAVEVTDAAGYEVTYCFRVTDAGEPLESYTAYPELTTVEPLDFYVQRGTTRVTGTSTTLYAGPDYEAPSASSSAFMRITNSQITGAGTDTGGGTFSAGDVTAYIEDGQNIQTSVTIARPSVASGDTTVSWEILEYIGIPGGDNEMIVRDHNALTYGATSLTATGTTVSGVGDDGDVVVFITGQMNPSLSVDSSDSDFNDGLSTSAWNSTSSVPVFERGDADSLAVGVSYAVVEFTGANWSIQRVEHNYSAENTTETEAITAVGSLSRTIVHAQKRVGNAEAGLNEFGHQVWLSSIGAVSFFLQGPTDPVDNPNLHYSVAWVIENMQTGTGAMNVYRSAGQLDNDQTVEPRTDIVSIGGTLGNISNASIWVTNESTGPGTAFPRAIMAARITSDTQYELWRSDTGQFQTFRTEVVEWPVAELSLRQNYYRFYVDNGAIDPTDPWPAGVDDLGEVTVMTDLDEPLGQGERVRIRMTLFVNNASFVEESKSFKLQYGRRVSICSAISSWTDVGAIGSGAIWRGYNGPLADGATLGTTTIKSVADVLGTYEEANNSAINPFTVDIGEDVEYDWVVENNGALEKSNYCFRMTESDGTQLDGYDYYPTVRTSGYTPVSDNWQWYDDEYNATPTTTIAALNVAPIDIGIGDILKLRVLVTEIEGATGQNIKFNLQYSESSSFADGGITLTATSSCTGGTIWCYADGVDIDNDIISTTTLSGADACTLGVGDGCGTHNEASGLTSSFTQNALTTSEHEFTIQHDGGRTNSVYYFRLVDATNGNPVLASSSYPSIVTEGATAQFTVSGIPSATDVEGITTDIDSTPTELAFGNLPIGSEIETGHILTADTNGTEGYRVLLYFADHPKNSYGTAIAGLTSTNISPQSWTTACSATVAGCFGYHVGDDTLSDGSARFAPTDSYAGVEISPQEVMFSSIPGISDQEVVIYKMEVNEGQASGVYETSFSYIFVPVF